MAKVLVVDDEPGSRETLVEILSTSDREVVGVASPEEAKREIKSGNVDLVITDYLMYDEKARPLESGIALAKWIKQWVDEAPEERAIKVVLRSTKSEQTIRDQNKDYAELLKSQAILTYMSHNLDATGIRKMVREILMPSGVETGAMVGSARFL